jgi:hypothetical protein
MSSLIQILCLPHFNLTSTTSVVPAKMQLPPHSNLHQEQPSLRYWFSHHSHPCMFWAPLTPLIVFSILSRRSPMMQHANTNQLNAHEITIVSGCTHTPTTRAVWQKMRPTECREATGIHSYYPHLSMIIMFSLGWSNLYLHLIQNIIWIIYLQPP